jgi:hypothetical protein
MLPFPDITGEPLLRENPVIILSSTKKSIFSVFPKPDIFELIIKIWLMVVEKIKNVIISPDNRKVRLCQDRQKE